MRVVHSVMRLDPAGGGPSVTVPAVCRHLREARPPWQIEITTEPTFLANLAAGDAPQVLHDHGQWAAVNHASAAAARRLGAKRIVSPRGMLSPWARRSKRWKKRLGWLLYARRDLSQAAAIHATSDLERRELRDLGVRQPVAVIPNGVEPFDLLPLDDAGAAQRYVLFMSRIHEKKGIAELLQAWRQLAPEGWELVLAGPDEQGLAAGCELPAGVRYVGMVEGEAKIRLLQAASVFVLPTHSENFGVVVAESLMAGTPVITTHGAPWGCLVDERCGWWIPMESGRLQSTLQTAMATPPSELAAMGARGRQLVARQFAWPEIASKMALVYEWIMGGGSPPEFVET